MAHLKACGEWELSALDRSHPVIASATLGELELALAEASRLLRCPLQGKVERWLGGDTEFAVGEASAWTPLREARCANLQWMNLSRGNVALAYNSIEVFQVCHRSDGGKRLYHVQPLSAPEAAAYFLSKFGETGRRLEAPIHNDFTPTRGPYGSMATSMLVTALSHTRFGELPAWEQPLHDFILSRI